MSQNYRTNCPNCGGVLVNTPKRFWEGVEDLNRQNLAGMAVLIPAIIVAGAVFMLLELIGIGEEIGVVLRMLVLCLVLVIVSVAWFLGLRGWRRVVCANCKRRFRRDQVIKESGAL